MSMLRDRDHRTPRQESQDARFPHMKDFVEPCIQSLKYIKQSRDPQREGPRISEYALIDKLGVFCLWQAYYVGAEAQRQFI